MLCDDNGVIAVPAVKEYPPHVIRRVLAIIPQPSSNTLPTKKKEGDPVFGSNQEAELQRAEEKVRNAEAAVRTYGSRQASPENSRDFENAKRALSTAKQELSRTKSRLGL